MKKRIISASIPDNNKIPKAIPTFSQYPTRQNECGHSDIEVTGKSKIPKPLPEVHMNAMASYMFLLHCYSLSSGQSMQINDWQVATSTLWSTTFAATLMALLLLQPFQRQRRITDLVECILAMEFSRSTPHLLLL